MDKKVSFIGLGAMGGPMAINIIKKGIDLFVHDIDENKINKVVKEGGFASNNILDAVKDSDIVITMLPATEQVKNVLLGENGVINNLKRNSFKLWRARVTGRKTKHSVLRENSVDRFKCNLQRGISNNKISKR